jgi:hypothetical protein
LIAGGLGLILTLAAAAPHTLVTTIAGELVSVTAVSPSQAWAVGTNGAGAALLLNWNGSTWTPTAGLAKTAGLNSVSADSASDAWAVGSVVTGGAVVNLALHWNGTSWAKVAVPSPGSPGATDELSGVSADSPSDAWAIGSAIAPGSGHDVMLHWNGTAWAQAAVPQPGRNSLLAVTALSPSDAWAVGVHTLPNTSESALILHWNGTSWARVTIPRIAGTLDAVSAVSPRDAWAVGTCCTGESSRQTMVLHWNGKAWGRQASPSPGTKAKAVNGLSGVSALSASSAWAAGAYGHFNPHGPSPSKTLILHWSGTAWAQVPSPSAGLISGLNSVAAQSPNDAWAVGGVFPAAGPETTLILHWDGTSWTRS